MSDQIKVIEHKESGGLGEYLLLGAVTAGAGFLIPPQKEKHTVTVQDTETGSYGVGKGSSYNTARENAIRDLNK